MGNIGDNYVRMALDLGAVDALMIGVSEIAFDPRTYLKCAWGCPTFGRLKCSPDLIKPWEAEPILRRYRTALLIHTLDSASSSEIAYEMERRAFLDGFYFAFALYGCSECEVCEARSRSECTNPVKARPGPDFMGIDVYATARKFGLPIEVLTNREERQNRYAFVFIE